MKTYSTNPKRVPDDVRKQIVAAYKAGASTFECATAFQRGLSTVQAIIREAGALRRSGPRKPRVHGVVIRDISDVTKKPAENDNAVRRSLHPIWETGGTWRGFIAYAEANGISLIETQKLWHQAQRGSI